MSPLALFYLAIATAGFGSTFALSNVAVDHFTPIQVACLRAIVATIATAVFVVVVGIKIPRSSKHLVIYGLLGAFTVAVPFTAIAWSQAYINSSLGGVVFASMPLITLLLGPLVLPDSTPTIKQLGGAIVGLVGVAIAASGGSLTPDLSLLIGALLTLFAVICYSIGGIYVKRYEDIDPRAMSFGQLIAAMIVMIIVSIPDFSSTALPATYQPYLVLIWLGVFSTAMPMMAIFLLIKEAGPAPATLTAFFMPLIAIAIGAIFLSEPITTALVIGCILVLVGAWFVAEKPQIVRSEEC